MSVYDPPRDTHPPVGGTGLAPRISRVLNRPGLARELIIIIAIKCAVLLIFKYTLFAHPKAPHMALPPAEVAQALLSVPASPPPASGTHHDQ
jgi:hypothetical protein